MGQVKLTYGKDHFCVGNTKQVITGLVLKYVETLEDQLCGSSISREKEFRLKGLFRQKPQILFTIILGFIRPNTHNRILHPVR
jgi:hypothetical protein